VKFPERRVIAVPLICLVGTVVVVVVVVFGGTVLLVVDLMVGLTVSTGGCVVVVGGAVGPKAAGSFVVVLDAVALGLLVPAVLVFFCGLGEPLDDGVDVDDSAIPSGVAIDMP
jgi:hypothetical protein